MENKIRELSSVIGYRESIFVIFIFDNACRFMLKFHIRNNSNKFLIILLIKNNKVNLHKFSKITECSSYKLK